MLCLHFPLFLIERDEEAVEREELRRDRAKDRQRDRNIARAAPDKR